MSQPLTFLVAFSAVVGTSEAIRQIQSDSKRKEHRSRKNNLIVRCPKSSQYSPILEGRRVVLSGDKLYIDTGTDYDQAFGHPFAGYFLPYPDSKYSGLVSTICDEPPIMNWIYIDRNTYEIKFGTRPSAQPNWPGPFDCSRQDRRLTFSGWEGFLAVKEGDFWALYFDVDEDNLKSKVKSDTLVLDIELLRVEMRVRPSKKEEPSAGGSEDTESKENPSGLDAKQYEQKSNEKEEVTQDFNLESPDVD
ncbi:hypothetical protein F4815DRAFT_450046 [Daldinia loculata]|uniref:uncharacterized protein n=1 Tax=Daldinia loculata TaxID=103429 RepID=UPI0020C52917|nr:uncharacterized protein F4817DRAFT_367932 [Daldinia loculata]KAI1643973.1 hypothetical protein F4817DRAFT_367932 [Daldinia loculata]KAI2775667.1 hypothetical protein F4815DRAFT_450046 [Daldinia loculata]